MAKNVDLRDLCDHIVEKYYSVCDYFKILFTISANFHCDFILDSGS